MPYRPWGRDSNSSQLSELDNPSNAALANAMMLPLNSDRVRMLFRVDRDRLLRLTMEDILTVNTLLDHKAVVRLS